jgi:hypothetical protein
MLSTVALSTVTLSTVNILIFGKLMAMTALKNLHENSCLSHSIGGWLTS